MLQLNNFNLTTPELKEGTTDTAKTYNPGQFPENHYFHTDAGGFWVEAETKALGTTANSDRARSELREVIEGTATQKNFKVTEFKDNILKATLKVTRAPVQKGQTVVGQIHVKDNNRPMFKLIHSRTGAVRLSMREVFNQEDPVNTDIVTNATLDKTWSYKLHMKDTNTLTVTVTVDGVVTSRDLHVDSSWNARNLYFKAGTYIQEDAISTTAADEGSSIYFSQLEVFHGVEVVVVDPPVEPEEPEVPEPTPYEVLTADLKAQEDGYYAALKVLQTEHKTKLNEMTTYMKTLTDKDALAPIYVEIKAFKDRMAAALVRPTV